MAELLNKQAYEVTPDNLVRAAHFPTLHRVMKITNPKAAIKRGQTVVYNAQSGALTVGGASDANIVGIASADVEAVSTGSTIAVDCYVAGAFNAEFVVGPTVTAAIVLGAQANGIYLV